MKEGHGGTGKGCHWKRKVSAALPYRLSLPKTVHFFTFGDKVLWILLLEVKGHGSRGITGWFITRARVRAHYMCAMFFEKQVFRADGRDLKGGNDGKPGNGGPVLSEWSENYGTVHFRNKRGRKKRYLTFKKVRLTF